MKAAPIALRQKTMVSASSPVASTAAPTVPISIKPDTSLATALLLSIAKGSLLFRLDLTDGQRLVKRIDLITPISNTDTAMSRPLDLDLLKTLASVVDSGSFSMAAHRLGRSQSAVSMQIQKLEATLDRTLLHRGPRLVTATPAGSDLLAYARRLLRISDEAVASLTSPGETGLVRLGIPEDYAMALLPPILERFAREHPRVTVELSCASTTSLAVEVKAGSLDLAIVTRFAEFPATVLRREPMVWAGSHRHPVWENDPLPIALFQTCAARANILRALAEAERRFACSYSSASLTGMTAIVQAGLAIAGLARCSVPTSLQILDESSGLPPLADLEIGLLVGGNGAACVQRLQETIKAEIGQVG